MQCNVNELKLLSRLIISYSYFNKHKMEDNQDLIYEDSEVLWAKIRGYPWWPAYVRDVHQAEVPADFEYTVIFFGDNTKYLVLLQQASSRLGPSKLRKFPEHYAECYLKAKTNKKLRQSIQKAEERLGENQQDVSYYKIIRNQMDLKRKKAGPMSESRVSSSQKVEPSDAIQLARHKTQQPIRNRKRKQTKNKEQADIFDELSINNNENSKSGRINEHKVHQVIESRRRRSQGLVSYNVIKKTEIFEQKQNSESDKSIDKPKRTIRINESNQSPVKIPRQLINMRSRQKIQQKIQQPAQEEVQSPEQSESKEQDSPIKQVKTRGRRGRKGRPPKSLAQKMQKLQKPDRPKMQRQLQALVPSEDGDEQFPFEGENRRVRKRVNKSASPAVIISEAEVQSGTLSQKQSQIIRKNLKNRKQLTRILLSMPITAGNIQQILDLGTSEALQSGQITKNIHLLLGTLKVTILHKYFPQNNKHRKKYIKMTKEKSKIIIHTSDQEDNEQIQDAVSDEDVDKNQMRDQKSDQGQFQIPSQHIRNQNKINKQPKKQSAAQKRTLEDRIKNLTDIRKKANEKLEKMIKRAGFMDRARDYALRIQSTFQSTADVVGQLYRNVAYRRMRSLKTKLSELGDEQVQSESIRRYLEEVITQYESEGLMVTTE